jgi:hypothetical protein
MEAGALVDALSHNPLVPSRAMAGALLGKLSLP